MRASMHEAAFEFKPSVNTWFAPLKFTPRQCGAVHTAEHFPQPEAPKNEGMEGEADAAISTQIDATTPKMRFQHQAGEVANDSDGATETAISTQIETATCTTRFATLFAACGEDGGEDGDEDGGEEGGEESGDEGGEQISEEGGKKGDVLPRRSQWLWMSLFLLTMFLLLLKLNFTCQDPDVVTLVSVAQSSVDKLKSLDFQDLNPDESTSAPYDLRRLVADLSRTSLPKYRKRITWLNSSYREVNRRFHDVMQRERFLLQTLLEPRFQRAVQNLNKPVLKVYFEVAGQRQLKNKECVEELKESEIIITEKLRDTEIQVKSDNAEVLAKQNRLEQERDSLMETATRLRKEAENLGCWEILEKACSWLSENFEKNILWNLVSLVPTIAEWLRGEESAARRMLPLFVISVGASVVIVVPGNEYWCPARVLNSSAADLENSAENISAHIRNEGDYLQQFLRKLQTFEDILNSTIAKIEKRQGMYDFILHHCNEILDAFDKAVEIVSNAQRSELIETITHVLSVVQRMVDQVLVPQLDKEEDSVLDETLTILKNFTKELREKTFSEIDYDDATS
mmetsp:Transcript_51124/g.101553  ORF Transcript_51124/g.101553 Transcript_51124/m.101553 type:complete len:570 (-) Transcript_51124:81-1790(-)|eukprot:CAMPEP_0172662868 /NCGR_PEP_ID=MMETSP1074-20121228/5588_1 /TAXON_ID=2916 /ORGANISM="Ceratium fusus, Strain PA161109" /LENGTH=569 /DNA_ID=CAMNT_0013478803 /DNA_START=90 /DNA_END=1799 /DNA_ORIENTATION=-